MLDKIDTAIDMADLPVQLPSNPADAASGSCALLQFRQCVQHQAAAGARPGFR